MASGQDLVKIAQAENGTKENGTNNVKYNTWFYGQEVIILGVRYLFRGVRIKQALQQT